MGCEVCEQSFAALLGGVVSIIYFILFPLMQIFLASIKVIFEKMGKVK